MQNVPLLLGNGPAHLFYMGMAGLVIVGVEGR